MKALTIIQPYAALIARGDKRVENRTWPTSYRGPLAMHAGTAKRYQSEPVTDIAAYEGVPRDELVFGAIVAVAELVDCVQLAENSSKDWTEPPFVTPLAALQRHPWMATHRHVQGPECWVLANVRRLAMPVALNGSQGLWDWTPAEDLVFVEAAGVKCIRPLACDCPACLERYGPVHNDTLGKDLQSNPMGLFTSPRRA